jgi:hypothetical protein
MFSVTQKKLYVIFSSACPIEYCGHSCVLFSDDVLFFQPTPKITNRCIRRLHCILHQIFDYQTFSVVLNITESPFAFLYPVALPYQVTSPPTDSFYQCNKEGLYETKNDVIFTVLTFTSTTLYHNFDNCVDIIATRWKITSCLQTHGKTLSLCARALRGTVVSDGDDRRMCNFSGGDGLKYF